MNLESIKEQLESNKRFLYWKYTIGLSFQDFTIYEHLNSFKRLLIKKGKKDIGNYYVVIKNNTIDSLSFDTSNEIVRQNRLKILGKLKDEVL